MGLERKLFEKDTAVPVASRGFVARHGPFDSPQSILDGALIHNIDSESW